MHCGSGFLADSAANSPHAAPVKLNEGHVLFRPLKFTSLAAVSNPIALAELLHSIFGFTRFRANQEEVCRAAIDGRDLLLVMPTGAGKSLCYQLPAIARGGTALVISPL